jgi:hypothetical protein
LYWPLVRTRLLLLQYPPPILLPGLCCQHCLPPGLPLPSPRLDPVLHYLPISRYEPMSLPIYITYPLLLHHPSSILLSSTCRQLCLPSGVLIPCPRLDHVLHYLSISHYESMSLPIYITYPLLLRHPSPILLSSTCRQQCLPSGVPIPHPRLDLVLHYLPVSHYEPMSLPIYRVFHKSLNGFTRPYLKSPWDYRNGIGVK